MPENKAKFKRLPDWAICLFLGAVVFLVYWRTTGWGFVSFDDPLYVSENPNIRLGFSFEGLSWAFNTWHAGYWIPVTWISFLLDYSIFGMNPFGFHLTNIVLHALNSILVYLFLAGATKQRMKSAFVAAVFAVHPLHVESVAWITERKDVLSAFFFLLALLSYLGYAKKPSIKSYAPVLILFALGLCAKPMIVTFPFVLLLLDHWPLDRLRGNVRRAVAEKIPLFIMSAIFSWLAAVTQKSMGAVVSLQDVSLGDRAVNAIASYVKYAFHFIRPMDLCAYYPFPLSGISTIYWFGALAIIVAVSLAAFYLARSRPYFFSGWFLFLGVLFPVMGLSQSGMQAMADRFMYIPLMGLAIMVAWGISAIFERIRFNRQILGASGASALIVLAGVAYTQAGVWKSDKALFEQALNSTRDNWFIHTAYAKGLYEEGRLQDAAAHLEKAIALRQEHATAHSTLGLVKSAMGRTEEAVLHCRRAVELDPGLASAHNNLGVVLYSGKAYGESINHFVTAIKLKPDYSDAHSNIAAAFIMTGMLDRAVAHAREAIRLNPDSGNAKSNLDLALKIQKIIREKKGLQDSG